MKPFCISPRPKAITKPRTAPVETNLCHAPAKEVNGGKTIEWAHGNAVTDLTPDEIEAIKRETGCKRVKMFRAVQIKSMMRTRTVAQMATALRCSERTVWGIRSALLSGGGGGE